MSGSHASADVRIWSLRTYKGQRGTTYTVTWVVAGQRNQRTFATRKLAETYRATLVRALRDGVEFRLRDGLPTTEAMAERAIPWFELAANFVDMKWPRASPKHRKSLAEGLATVTCVLTTSAIEPSDERPLRAALMGWGFNTSARGGVAIDMAEPPEEHRRQIEWLRSRSLPLHAVRQASEIRRALEAVSLRLDGTPASAATVARKRSALFSALQYAVELELLDTNPLQSVQWTQPVRSNVVDRRVVVNPQQAKALLDAVRQVYPSLEAFFACMYYAALRPAEVRHLRLRDCTLPDSGWGNLILVGSTTPIAAHWTDTGQSQPDRHLKHRASRETRPVPATPELVETLRRHIADYPPGVDGRLFVTRTRQGGRPLAGPYGTPVSMNTVYRVWALARSAVLSPEQIASPLARRPYDLRHAAVSLWLSAGVPPTQVAEWAGHSVNVLLRVYAQVLDDREEEAKTRIAQALELAGGNAGAPKTSRRIPGGQP